MKFLINALISLLFLFLFFISIVFISNVFDWEWIFQEWTELFFNSELGTKDFIYAYSTLILLVVGFVLNIIIYLHTKRVLISFLYIGYLNFIVLFCLSFWRLLNIGDGLAVFGIAQLSMFAYMVITYIQLIILLLLHFIVKLKQFRH